jgi:hypothetical protein
MSAKDQARMLIDQLMGSTNDGKFLNLRFLFFQKKKQKNFSLFFFQKKNLHIHTIIIFNERK